MEYANTLAAAISAYLLQGKLASHQIFDNFCHFPRLVDFKGQIGMQTPFPTESLLVEITAVTFRC